MGAEDGQVEKTTDKNDAPVALAAHTDLNRPPASERTIPEDPSELREELVRARASLHGRNVENTKQRLRLEELERIEDERKNGELSEMDKLKRQLGDFKQRELDTVRAKEVAEARLVETRINNAVERQALAMGFEYPDIAPQLIDRKRVVYDPETEKVDGVKEALERLLKDRPGLVKASPRGGTPPRDFTSRGGVVGNGSRNDRGTEVRTLTPTEDLLNLGGYS